MKMAGPDSVSSTTTEINHEQISSQTSVCWGRLFQILTAPFFYCKTNLCADLQSNDEVPHPRNYVHWQDEPPVVDTSLSSFWWSTLKKHFQI